MLFSGDIVYCRGKDIKEIASGDMQDEIGRTMYLNRWSVLQEQKWRIFKLTMVLFTQTRPL